MTVGGQSSAEDSRRTRTRMTRTIEHRAGVAGGRSKTDPRNSRFGFVAKSVLLGPEPE